MTGEKDPRDVMQAEHDAGLSEHPAFRVTAEMPGVEEIHAAFVEAQRQYRAERDAALAKQGYWPDRSPAPLDVLAKVAQALFAPILAETERATVKRIAQVASEVAAQAGVGASETAGLIVSVLAANPEQTERFMAEGSELFIDGTIRPENGCLTHMAMNGQVVSPTRLRMMKGQSQ